MYILEKGLSRCHLGKYETGGEKKGKDVKEQGNRKRGRNRQHLS
jgi:hypothetical protein